MLKTKMNKLILKTEKARKTKLIEKIKFEIQLEDETEANRKH